jgi:group I intron endonuclease
MSGTNENNDILYLHITPCGKKYFGVASTTAKKRWRNGGGYINNEYFTRAIEKYGWDNIEHIILAEGLTSFEADLFEIFCIAYYNTMNRDIGYNLTSGGRKHYHHAEETKQKMKDNHADVSGENNPFYGKYHSEETRQKMRENHADLKGKKSCLSKTVICITTRQVYYGICEAERATGAKRRNISAVCNGNGDRKHAGKLPDGTPLKWAFVKDLPKPQVSEDKKQLLRNGPKPLKIVC